MILVRPDDAVPERLLLMRLPCQRQHMLGDQVPEREVGLIRRRRTPGFHGVPSLEESPNLIVECALAAAARKVVPNADPHRHNSRCVLTGHLSVGGGGACTLLLLQGRALCYMTAMLEDSLMRGSLSAACRSERLSWRRREGRSVPRIMHRSGVRRVGACPYITAPRSATTWTQNLRIVSMITCCPRGNRRRRRVGSAGYGILFRARALVENNLRERELTDHRANLEVSVRAAGRP